jgi:hypothetical protein
MPASIKQRLAPLIDVAAPTKDSDLTSAQRYVQKNLDRVQRFVADVALAFVDSSELDTAFRMSNGAHPITAACEAVNATGTRAVPVTGLHRDAAHHQAALTAAMQMGAGLCIRLDATDVSTSRLSFTNISSLISEHGLSTEQIFLMLDMQGLFGREAAGEAAQVMRFLSLAEGYRWGGVIVGGYGLPEQLSTTVPPNSQAYIPRVEQALFKMLNRDVIRSPMWFADYVVLPPSVVELDWRLIHKVMTPKAIYTMDDSWLVVRGGAFTSHPQGREQYYSIAKEIVALSEFSGSNFSAGDKYIHDRAEEKPSPGSPGSWITACVNHHITFTALQHEQTT